MAPLPAVSVIVPCHSADYGLETVLRALLRQDYRGELEILVANDGINTGVSLLCSKFGVIEVPVAKSGSSYRARNEAIRRARGTVLAFTDSNKVPRLDWVSMGVSGLDRLNCSYLAGRIQLLPNSRQGKTFSYWYQVYRAFPNRYYVEKMHFGVTGNLFAKKSLFDAGLFDEDAVSGGDRDWGRRVFHAGNQQKFSAETVVSIEARTFSALALKQIRTLEGNLRYDLREAGVPGHAISWKRILFCVIPPVPIALNSLESHERRWSVLLRVGVVAFCLGLAEAYQLIQFKIGRPLGAGKFY